MSVLERSDAFLRWARIARAWQLVAFFLLASNTVLAAGFVQLAMSSRVVPYLVEVDGHGNTRYAGPIEVADLPEERLLFQQLRSFLWNLRVVVPDATAQGKLLARAYALADTPVRRALDEHFAAPGNDPRTIAARASRSVEAITLLRLPEAPDTYQLDWKEVYVDRRGFGTLEERSFRGLATVRPVRDATPEILIDNPLGVVITAFTWTETTQNR
ncbi:MAG TPA: VirB8/TrbF family protein [Thermoanaerobaculia bacterium]|nr:VirB8/TrbF family protein [Thermoanaerobaculia bacterium]